MSISNSKIYILKLALILIVGGILLVFINILNDPNALFHNHKNGESWREPNQNYLKMQHLLKQSAKEILIFGSSRVQTIPLSKSKFSENSYNMGTYGRTLWNTLHDLRILNTNNKLPRTILLGLDEATYAGEDKDRQELKVSVAYPDGFIELLNFFKVYLLTKDQTSYEFIEKYFNPPLIPGRFFDLDRSGEIFHYRNEKAIHSNSQAWGNNPVFQINYAQRTGPSFPENLTHLQEVINICKNNNIKLIVFFNPVFKKFFLQADLERLLQFKKQVALLVNYFDYHAVDQISADTIYWYDQDHYRPILGQIILDEVYLHSNTKENKFSTFVTLENIEEQTTKLRDYFIKNNPPLQSQ